MGETECLDSAEILDIPLQDELIENAVGDPCSICEGPSGYNPIQDDFDITFWICDRCDAVIELGRSGAEAASF